MLIWSTDYLNRIALEAETEIAKELNCIIDRYSLAVEQYLSEYPLPSFITNIRRVIWKGFRLDPVSHVNSPYYSIPIETYSEDDVFDVTIFQEDTFDSGAITISNGAAGGRPLSYFYSGFGENIIKFNGPANETIGFYSNLWSSDIPNAVIVEFYRTPDGLNWKIPHYIRRRTIKNYVLWKAFAKEGPGQNLNASAYFETRYLITLEKARSIINNIYRTVNTERGPSDRKEISREFLKRRGPRPWNYGIVVGDYEDD